MAESDLPIFFEHQREPEAIRMALFPARDREAFDAHWQRVLADDTATTRTILFEGQVAGYIAAFDRGGRREVAYWIGSEFWGKGLATKALAELLVEEKTRPLYATVATSNVGSIRVLAKCGFVIAGYRREFDEAFGEKVEEALLELT